MIEVMIMKDTEKKNHLEPQFCECFVFVLMFVFGLSCWFSWHTEQGGGQAVPQAPLQETGHHLRAEGWGPEISCEHLQCNACKSGMGGPTASSTP